MAEVNQSPAVSQFLNTQFSQAAQDGQIKPREARQLNALIDQMNLPDADKSALKDMVKQLKDSSNQHFLFFNFKKPVTESDMAKLQELGASNGLANQLFTKFQEMAQATATSSPEAAADQSSVRPPVQGADFDPNQSPFAPQTTPTQPGASQTPAAQGTENAGQVAASQEPSSTRPSWYVNQYASHLPSSTGDCGPASAAMVARSFGFQTDLDNTSAVQAARTASGKTQPDDGGHWAIDEQQVNNAVEGLTNGQVTNVGRQEFRAGQADALKQSILDSLARGERPVLLTGQEKDGTTGRHYMVVTGVDQNGDLLMADPAIDFSDYQNDDFKNTNFSFAPPMSMAELAARLERTEHTTNPGTVLMSFAPRQ